MAIELLIFVFLLSQRHLALASKSLSVSLKASLIHAVGVIKIPQRSCVTFSHAFYSSNVHHGLGFCIWISFLSLFRFHRVCVCACVGRNIVFVNQLHDGPLGTILHLASSCRYASTKIMNLNNEFLTWIWCWCKGYTLGSLLIIEVF